MDDGTTRLPPEVLDLIIEHAEKDIPTLVKLCLVCRGLLPQARRVLYDNISLLDTGHNRGAPGRKNTMLKLLHTVAAHPTLARNVRSFSYRGRQLKFDWWERMNGALQKMINLRSFTLQGAQLPLANTLFKDCSFRLHSFIWNNHDFQAHTPRPQSPEEEHIRQFLSTQNTIRTLSAPFVSTQVSPIICPSLDTLVGDTRTIMNVLPGRDTVTKLVWDETQWDNVFKVESISQPLSYVQTFILGGFVPRHSLVTYIPYLENLKTLHLFGRAFSISLEKELEYIASLPRLGVFIWSPSQSDSSPEYQLGLIPKKQQRAFVTRWFRDIPSFRLAYFARCSPRQDSSCFLRWTRDGAEVPVAFGDISRETNIDT